eukprot:5254595-Prymnesium_polylepis.1
MKRFILSAPPHTNQTSRHRGARTHSLSAHTGTRSFQEDTYTPHLTTFEELYLHRVPFTRGHVELPVAGAVAAEE